VWPKKPGSKLGGTRHDDWLYKYIGPKRLLLSMVNTAAASSGVWSQLAVGTRQGMHIRPHLSHSHLCQHSLTCLDDHPASAKLAFNLQGINKLRKYILYIMFTHACLSLAWITLWIIDRSN